MNAKKGEKMTILQEFAVAFGEMFDDLAKALFGGGGAKPAARSMEFEPPEFDRSPFSKRTTPPPPVIDSHGNWIGDRDYLG
ncbi:MAG: hypothetical protein JNJ60_16890 [Rhodocyclaceae bacterium]|nr:hypothetical protein [Rhodocyclaceae bacterium]